MSNSNDDSGVIQALLDRLNNYRLPRALALKKKVENGETLDEFDMKFLNRVFTDAEFARGMIDRHPEVQPLVVKLVALYSEISAKALENEKKKQGLS